MVELIKNSHRCDIDQTGSGTSPATHAAKKMMCFQNVFSLPHEAVSLAQRPAFSKVMPSCDSGKFIELAGIPVPHSLAVLHIQADFIPDVEAKTCRAHVGARGAGEAELASFIPQRALHTHIEQGRQIADIEVKAVGESRPFLAQSSVKFLNVPWSGIFDRRMLK
jgi:hypothetical protein